MKTREEKRIEQALCVELLKLIESFRRVNIGGEHTEELVNSAVMTAVTNLMGGQNCENYKQMLRHADAVHNAHHHPERGKRREVH